MGERVWRGPTKGTFLGKRMSFGGGMLDGGWRGVRGGLGYRFVLLGIDHGGRVRSCKVREIVGTAVRTGLECEVPRMIEGCAGDG